MNSLEASIADTLPVQKQHFSLVFVNHTLTLISKSAPRFPERLYVRSWSSEPRDWLCYVGSWTAKTNVIFLAFAHNLIFVFRQANFKAAWQGHGFHCKDSIAIAAPGHLEALCALITWRTAQLRTTKRLQINGSGDARSNGKKFLAPEQTSGRGVAVTDESRKARFQKQTKNSSNSSAERVTCRTDAASFHSIYRRQCCSRLLGSGLKRTRSHIAPPFKRELTRGLKLTLTRQLFSAIMYK